VGETLHPLVLAPQLPILLAQLIEGSIRDLPHIQVFVLCYLDLFLCQLLQEYESWHERIQRIWKRYKPDDSLERLDAIEAEFPVIWHLGQTDRFVGEFTPEYIVLNILAPGKPRGQSNVFDLKKALARARRIRRALKPLGIEFAPPMPWLSEFQESVGKFLAKLHNEPSSP
jgi:hypothetical protein